MQLRDTARHRRGRWVATGVVVATLVGAAGCSAGRSVDAYCGVIDTHKDRYLSAMGDVSTSGDLLSGLTGMISALGDLSRMWEEAAEVAPDEIRTDVEAVRDAWAAQFEAAENMASDPLGGLAAGLVGAFTSAGAMERVDTYTAENCPGVGGMFSAAAPVNEPDPEPEAEPLETPTPEPAQAARLDLEGTWRPFGPYLTSSRNDEFDPRGPIDLYIPGTGEVTLSASELLPGDDVTDERFTHGADGDGPFIVGLVQIRVPASGLEPEYTIHSVLRIEPSLEPAVTARVDLEDPDYMRLGGASGDSMVFVNRDATGLSSADEVIAVDLANESVAWRQAGAVVGRFHPDRVVFRSYAGNASVCTASVHGGDSTVTVAEPATGEIYWQTVEANGDCTGPRYESIVDGRYVQYGEDRETRIAEVRDIVTGVAAGIPIRVRGTDPVSSLAWGYLATNTTAGGDLNVVDLSTGAVTYEMERETVNALRLEIRSIFDGRLYVSTTDEQLIVDARTGEEVGYWTEYPVATAGHYTQMSDGSYRLDWSPTP